MIEGSRSEEIILDPGILTTLDLTAGLVKNRCQVHETKYGSNK